MSASRPTAAKTGALRVDLAGRRVLITGGSRGIAGAIAHAFANNGAAIALNYCEAADRRAGFPDASEEMLASLSQAGVQAIGIYSDLT
jgi:3-oxoacyl-[acyl-carrier protein] reductase